MQSIILIYGDKSCYTFLSKRFNTRKYNIKVKKIVR